MKRRVRPVYVKPPPLPKEAFDALLPRAALRELDPEAEARLPWGAHPDDDQFRTEEVDD